MMKSRYFSIHLRLEVDTNYAQFVPLHGYLRNFHRQGGYTTKYIRKQKSDNF